VERLTIIVPPSTIAALTSASTEDEGWMYKIPYQRLDLGTDGNTDTTTGATSSEPSLRDMPGIRDGDHNLYSLAKWNGVTYNQGTYLNIYKAYQYFEKRPPSIFSRRMVAPIFDLLEYMTSLTWIAVFPHFNRVDTMMELMTIKPARLQRLEVQFIPSPSSIALDDVDLISRGGFSLNDCWSEVSDGYRHIVNMLGHCRWVPPGRIKIREFKCMDCHHPAMKKELEELFEKCSRRWTKVGMDEWHLNEDGNEETYDDADEEEEDDESWEDYENEDEENHDNELDTDDENDHDDEDNDSGHNKEGRDGVALSTENEHV